uniref:SCD domain-containing protein n=1 Tax=Rhodosorus marinus TaxID=101924 RepID=A0A7S3E9P3_9RHOD|mmetsp:Transcript_19047/g.76509  ORF Transcript_19047/g.76509 Transcript_19047/m.76509 type:complete len:979 (+) Transcript_19047:70-3006(+)
MKTRRSSRELLKPTRPANDQVSSGEMEGTTAEQKCGGEPCPPEGRKDTRKRPSRAVPEPAAQRIVTRSRKSEEPARLETPRRGLERIEGSDDRNSARSLATAPRRMSMRSRTSEETVANTSPSASADAEKSNEKETAAPKRTRGSVSSPEAETRAGEVERPVKTRRRGNHNTVSLFEEILLYPNALATTASNWQKRARKNQSSAIVEAIDLVIRSARGQESLHVTELREDQLEAEEFEKFLEDAASDVSKCQAPFLLKKERSSRRFRSALGGFFSRIARMSDDELLYGMETVPRVIQLLKSMSIVHCTSLRLAATVAAFGLVDGIVQVLKRNTTAQASMSQQLEIARNQERRRGAARGGKAADIEKKLNEMRSQCGSLNLWMEEIVAKVWRKRMRDSFPDLRSFCSKAMETWVLENTAFFLVDANTAAVGSLLYDRTANVRLAALSTAQSMVRSLGFDRAQEFISKSTGRFLEMCEDQSFDVSSTAVNLLEDLMQYELLTVSQHQHILKMVLEEASPQFYKAIGSYTSSYLSFILNQEASTQSAPVARRSGSRDSGVDSSAADRPEPSICKALVRLTIETEGGSRHYIEALSECLWNELPALRSWKTVVDLLEDDLLSPEEQLVTARYLACIVSMMDNHARHRVGGAQSKKMWLDEFTAEIAPRLRGLLERHKGDAEMTQLLIELFTGMEFGYFKLAGLGSELEGLVVAVEESMNRHPASTEVLEASFSALARYGEQTSSESSSTAISGRFWKGQEAMLEDAQGRGRRGASSRVAKLVSGLQAALESSSLCPSARLVANLNKALENMLGAAPQDETEWMKVAGVTYLALVRSMRETVQSGNEDLRENTDDLVRSCEQFMSHMASAMKGKASIQVKSFAAAATVELLNLAAGAGFVAEKQMKLETEMVMNLRYVVGVPPVNEKSFSLKERNTMLSHILSLRLQGRLLMDIKRVYRSQCRRCTVNSAGLRIFQLSKHENK